MVFLIYLPAGYPQERRGKQHMVKKQTKLNCQQCGDEFETTRPDLAKYCSHGCRNDAYMARKMDQFGVDSVRKARRIIKLAQSGPGDEVNRCSECGEPISARATTCGSTCRTRRSRRLEREEAAAELAAKRQRSNGKGNRVVELTRAEWEAVRDVLSEVPHAWALGGSYTPEGWTRMSWDQFVKGHDRTITFGQWIDLCARFPNLHLEERLFDVQGGR